MINGPSTIEPIRSPSRRRRSVLSRAALKIGIVTARQIARTARAISQPTASLPPPPLSQATSTARILNSRHGVPGGEEPGGDLEGDRSAQHELPVSGGGG